MASLGEKSDFLMSSSSSENQLSVLQPDEMPVAETPAAPEKHSYGQILKSSALVGGSSAVNIALGIVRTKAMALLLGPAGFGLFGLYGSIANLAQSAAGMGISSSGVRQIAEAVASENAERIAVTTIVLRRTSILLGTLGAAFLIVFCRQVSVLTFGTTDHAAAVALLSLAVFFQLVSGGQSALIQGMRRIFDLAKLGVIGALFGTLASILLVFWLRDKGVVPSLVAVSLMSLALSWWYSRTVKIQPTLVSASQVWQEAGNLLKLGFAFMAAVFMSLGIAYAVRIILLRKVGFEATGFYQSAWTIGGLYVGFILQAMGADFYPRLTASASDNTACNRLVNEQTRVGLLLAGPGLIATLTFTPLVTTVFYSAKFGAAVGVLRWICLGTILQVITWPMGFIIIAKAKRATYFVVELAWALVSLGLAWICIIKYGLNGAGIAFFGSYVFYGFLLYPIVHRISGFHWSPANLRTGLLFLLVITIVFGGFYLLSFAWATSLGTLAVLGSGFYSLWVLSKLVSQDQIPGSIQRILARFGLIRRAGA
jgi:PST family polysaccharide transporter